MYSANPKGDGYPPRLCSVRCGHKLGNELACYNKSRNYKKQIDTTPEPRHWYKVLIPFRNPEQKKIAMLKNKINTMAIARRTSISSIRSDGGLA